MTFQTHNEIGVSITGTSLQGEIRTTYFRLSHAFGKPFDGDGYKTDAEWAIQFDDGVIAAIYNWKNGINYLGDDGLPVEKITHWNIGGHSAEAVRRVKEVLDEVSEDLQTLIEEMYGTTQTPTDQ